jgi:uncharacterized membrane protein
MRQLHRNYYRRFIPAMLAYVLVLFGSIYLLRGMGKDASIFVKIALALAPIIPIVFVCTAMTRYVRECDEMERRIELESIAIASIGVGMLFMCAGFLAAANIIPLDGASVAIWVFPSLCGIYGLAKLFSVKRYQ